MTGSTIRDLAAACGLLLLTTACSGQRQPASPAKSARVAKSQPVVQQQPVEPLRPEVPALSSPSAVNGELVDEPGARELQPGEDVDREPAVAALPQSAADAETLLHAALDAYSSANTFWKQGEFDDAFAALDHAYERMTQIDLGEVSEGTEGEDLVLAQEKENLRRMISRRIVEIYASRKSAVGDPDGSIPQLINAEVEREIASFQGRERDFFLEAYRRSGLYRPMILAQLREAGLPEQLSWLPLVESGFKDRALSSARALGLWQFIPSTGYRYGLDRSNWVDERMDPEKSTQAAIAYLSALHEMFGDWLTALAGYNCGEHNVLRQIKSQKEGYFDQFWDLFARLPRETRRYVPRFLATIAILEDPEKFGFVLPQPLPPLQFETVAIARSAQLDALDRALAFEPGTLVRLNPELRRNGSPETPYQLRVPPGSGSLLVERLAQLPRWNPPAVVASASGGVHRVRSGETLSQIATRYRTSVRAIMALNNLRSADRLALGQRLQIPGGGGNRTTTASDGSMSSGTYIVRRGDTPGSIAQRAGVGLSQLLAANKLRSGSTIYPGQQLTIPN